MVHIENLINYLKLKIKSNYEYETILEYGIELKKTILGFTNDKLFKFLKIKVINEEIKKKLEKIIKWNLKNFIKSSKSDNINLELFEEHIDPMLQFVYYTDLNTAGWLRIEQNNYIINTENKSNCQYEIDVLWNNIDPLDEEKIAPILIASFDIECYSSNGEFPQSKKTYRKLAINLLDHHLSLIKKRDNLFSNKHWEEWEEMCVLIDDPENFKEYLRQLILSAFEMGNIRNKFIDKIITKKNKKPDIEKLSLLMCKIADIMTNSYHDHSNSKEQKINTLSTIFNENLPKIEGDEIIQIGLTIQEYGKDKIKKILICLKDCEYIEDIEIISCQNEKDLLLSFQKLIKDIDPDIIIGYNINQFDFEYMYNRSIETKCSKKFLNLGRRKEIKSTLIELQNTMYGNQKIINMEGRIVIDIYQFVQKNYKLESNKLNNVAQYFLKENKKDLDPQDIFKYYKGNAKDRSIIAEYCIQDCMLCNKLCDVLDILTNNMAFANLVKTPLSYTFNRGIGIKILSLLAKYCKKNDYLIPKINPFTENNECFEGACVIDATKKMYLENPVIVLDYRSLYPSTIIAENLCFSSIVLDNKYSEIPGVNYKEIEYSNYKLQYTEYNKPKKIIDEAEPIKKIKFAENGKKNILPIMLEELLNERETIKNKILTESDPLKKKIMNGKQLSIKLAANSIYGLIGSKTSHLYMSSLASSITAYGREMLYFAKKFVEEKENMNVVYGDTDSLFIETNYDEEYLDNEKIKTSIEIGLSLEKEINSLIKKPHKFEFEKCFYPFILFSKKRYVGCEFDKRNYYDNDYSNKKIENRGTISIRSDSAKIAKKVYNGVIELILHEKQIDNSVVYLKKQLINIIEGKFIMDNFIIGKKIKEYYDNPETQAHKMLADRIAYRNPSLKPKPGDKVEYIFIETENKKKKLLGDCVEDPKFITENNLTIDYAYYITNQIMKPLCELYGLQIENPKDIFSEILAIIDNKKNNNISIDNWIEYS